MEDQSLQKGDLERIFNQWLNAPELRSEVRGYLRHRLYTALHNSQLGPSLNQLDVHPVSPKLQTLNLLIAEYLLRQRHHFTLSVFSCEAPNVSCISPNVPETLKVQSLKSSGSPIFGKEDFYDIIETLGLPKESELIVNLVKMYTENRDQALLTCLIRSLPEFYERSQNVEKSEALVDAKPQEVERFQQEMVALSDGFQRELQEKNEKIGELQQLLLANNDTLEQNKTIKMLSDQLKLMEVQFKNFEAAKEKEFYGLKKLNRSLENEMLEMQGVLEARKKHLRDEEFKVEREKLVLKRNKKKLQKHQKQLDEVSIALTENFPDQSILPALEIQLQMKDQEVTELKSKCQSLQDENKMLQALSAQQRNRIESLNDKVVSLVGELHAAKERALRARQAASDGDSSPTDDVVKDARRRIRSLEQEFEAIEKQHREYKNKSDPSALMNISSQVSVTEPPALISPRRTPFTSTLIGASRSPGLTMVEEIQSSIKSLQDSIKAKPEKLVQMRFDRYRSKMLDLSVSSISSESTGFDIQLKSEEPANEETRAKTAFSERLDASISPIANIQPKKLASPGSPEINLTTQLPESPPVADEKKELCSVLKNLSIEAEPLGTSVDLKLTIPSSSSSGSSVKNIPDTTPIEAVVVEKVGELKLTSVETGRLDGDGMVETSTSEDRSVPIVTGGGDNDDDDFWGL